jgi:hypothetical protein
MAKVPAGMRRQPGDGGPSPPPKAAGSERPVRSAGRTAAGDAGREEEGPQQAKEYSVVDLGVLTRRGFGRRAIAGDGC